MAFNGAHAKSSAASVGKKAAVAAAVAWTQRRRGAAASRPQTSEALTRAPASPSDTEKAAPPPVPSLRASVLPSHHHLRSSPPPVPLLRAAVLPSHHNLRSSPPPVPLLRSVKCSGEGRSKDAVGAGPPRGRRGACRTAVGLLSPNYASHRHCNVASAHRRRGAVAVAEEPALQRVVEELRGTR